MNTSILIIMPRLPDDLGSKNGRRLSGLVRALAQKYDVHLTYLQTMFGSPDILAPFKEQGVTVVPGEIFKRRIYGKGDDAPAHSYRMVFFTSSLIAKYYIPRMDALAPGAMIVIDTAGSSYLAHARSSALAADPVSGKVYAKAAIAIKAREIPLCANADILIAGHSVGRDTLQRDLPQIPVFLVPEYSGRGEEPDVADALIQEAFAAAEQQGPRQPPEITSGLIERVYLGTGESGGDGVRLLPPQENESQVAHYNRALKSLTAEWGLLMPDESRIDQHSVQRLLFAVHRYPGVALAAPESSDDTDVKIGLRDLEGFLTRHSLVNFGNWQEVKKISSRCFMIRRSAVDTIGFLDTRFRTLTMALFDYSLRIFQAGHRILVNHEAFAWFPAEPASDVDRADRRLLLEKWGNAGARVLDRLAGAANGPGLTETVDK